MNAQYKKGFTIIEVVLVLAIAALIFLMVFIALPALQANQRDTARKNDASTVAAAVQSFVSNERRALTTDSDDVDTLRSYIEGLDQYDAADEGTIQVDDQVGPGDTIDVDEEQIHVYLGVKCDGTDVKEGVTRSAAVFVRLEGSGGSLYCVDV